MEYPDSFLHLAISKLDEISTNPDGIDVDDFYARVLCEISIETAAISKIFLGRRRKALTENQLLKLQKSIREIIKWVSALEHVVVKEDISVENILEFAEEINDEIQQDGILASLSIQSSLWELSEVLFKEDGGPVDPSEVVQIVAEILATCVAICRRTGCEFQELLLDF